MAIAFETVGSPLYGNEKLMEDILLAMEWMYRNMYNENADQYANWWDWEIGIPMALNDCTIIMHDWLTPEQRTGYMKAVERWSPVVDYTGANRVWKCIVVLVRA